MMEPALWIAAWWLCGMLPMGLLFWYRGESVHLPELVGAMVASLLGPFVGVVVIFGVIIEEAARRYRERTGYSIETMTIWKGRQK